jgi:hypothetical protein
MNPNYDWLDDLAGGCDDLTAMAKTTRKFISKTTAISYAKASCAALALPLFTLATVSDIPVIKATPQMRDTMILSTTVSSIAPSPVHEIQAYYLSTGD